MMLAGAQHQRLLRPGAVQLLPLRLAHSTSQVVSGRGNPCQQAQDTHTHSAARTLPAAPQRDGVRCAVAPAAVEHEQAASGSVEEQRHGFEVESLEMLEWPAVCKQVRLWRLREWLQ